jgi:hypothetical protein
MGWKGTKYVNGRCGGCALCGRALKKAGGFGVGVDIDCQCDLPFRLRIELEQKKHPYIQVDPGAGR